LNFEAMPELKWRWGYPFALGVISATCGFLYWRFKKLGWL
jgi:magnesium transporter